jgi:beta-1,4-mannosyltransferase
MRVAFFWEAAGLAVDRTNPYGGLLARALEEQGAQVVAGHAEELTEDWLRENRGSIDVLHIHWPHALYKAPGPAARVSRCRDVIRCLARARSLGYKVVWTVHNLYPHESPSPELDEQARLAITQLATAVIVHCEKARVCVRDQFFREDGVFVIPHGHFMDAYPNIVTRPEARERLGIPDGCFTYVYFGNVRPYKGLERLLRAFSRLPGDSVRLLLAAKIFYEYGAGLVERAAEADPRIVAVTSLFFPNEDLQVFFNAADVAVFPFLDVLTSGSVMTALSFGRPVIVPALGCLTELVDGSVGILYEPSETDALGKALVDIRKCDLEDCGQAARWRAKSFSWRTIAEQTLAAYRR